MEPTDDNRRAWEELHRGRGEDGRSHAGLPHAVRHALADLHGKRVLTLRSGTGDAAGELAELGATVTAVDTSLEALESGRSRWPSILWVEGDAQALPPELRRARFDLVYSGPGVLASLDDVDGWARGIAAALHSGGDVLVYDEHPVATSVDGLMHWRASYFDERAGSGRRRWRLGQVVTAIARAGLAVRALEEYPQQPGNERHHDARVPGAFLLHAQRR